jgi:UDP-4-amino-4,6-dideoxy-N-acetyl-beta-L-altrosamine transaminase
MKTDLAAEDSYIPYSRQHIDESDIAAVVAVLQSDWLTQGPAIPRFEQVVADYCGAQHAVAVNSATSALHIAALALGLAPGDRLWTTPNTFVASANCGRYCGATVDFVDIDRATGNLDPQALARRLELAAKCGKLPRIVVPVHFAGQPCAMAEIRALADHYRFAIIEDASHAIGARYAQSRVGSGEYSEITIFSFHPVKIITTGEGGMAVTNDLDLAQRMRLLRSHGITRDTTLLEGGDGADWYYEQQHLGYNYRMTDLQAALGASQMRHLDEFIDQRTRLAARYDQLLAALPVQPLIRYPEYRSALHLYPVALHPALDRRRIFDAMRKSGVGVNVHYIPIHLQPYYRRLGFSVGDFPHAEAWYRHTLTLPLYPDLSLCQQDRVVAALTAAIVEAGGDYATIA